MPSIGLPRILEQTISNILDISQLSSFKIAGNGPRTTILLRFDECMADASVSPIHRSTPRSWKPPIQMRRDRDRMEQHRNLAAEKIVAKTTVQDNTTKIRDGRPPDLSGIPDFCFLLSWKNKPEPGKLTIFFYRGKNGGMMRHYCRPATHPDLIGYPDFSVQI